MKIIITLLLAIALLSCNQNPDKAKNTGLSKKKENIQINTTTEKEKFEKLNSEEINKKLERKSENLSAQDVMKLYYPHKVEANDEGNEKIEISERKLENGNSLVTLIHDNFLDDSVRGEKYIMELKNTNDKWKIISIRRNWKCWTGRGHTDWGTELCN